jgi:monofunctional biosynthetic peptidoglycan transglycosylase
VGVVTLGLVGFAVLATSLPVLFLGHFPPVATAFTLRSRFADPATGQPCRYVERRWVDWEDISRHVAVAVVVAEDQRFLAHPGFDLHAIGEAVREGLDEGRVRGASTLSQQLAKNLFLWPGRSVVRKGLEAWFTAWIELLWPKRRILEMYLNVAQFGPCVFGVEAASRRYFDRPAAQLTREQAARLAAVLPNPARLRVREPGPWVTGRTDEILAWMDRLEGSRHLEGL